MKKIFSLSFITLTGLLFILQASVVSCKKEKVVYVSKDTAVTAQILTANSWKSQEHRGVEGGAKVLYVRGATSGNTVNYDTEYMAFNSNGTGTHDNPGIGVLPLTWTFGNADNTKLIITITNPSGSSVVVTWDNLRYKNGSLYYDQYWTQGTIHSHTQDIRIPK